jgi:hypothetical protein
VVVVAKSDSAAAALEGQLVIVLEEAGLVDAAVEVQVADRIERHVQSDELKRFVRFSHSA